MSRRMCVAAVVAVSVPVVACGRDDPPGDVATTRTSSTLVTPRTPRVGPPHVLERTGAWRLIRDPVVVLIPNRYNPAPSVEILVRLNRRLSPRADEQHITLNVENLAAGTATTGLGWDVGRPGNCYTRGATALGTTLQHARPGRRVKLTLQVFEEGEPVAREVVRTRLRAALPGQEGGLPDARWVRALGCRPR